MLLRLASAAIGLPILVFVVWFGPPDQKIQWFSAFIFIVAIIATIEVRQLAAKWGESVHVGIPVILTAFMIQSGHQAASGVELKALGELTPDFLVTFTKYAVVISMYLAALRLARTHQIWSGGSPRLFSAIAISVYASGFLFFAPQIRALDQGMEWIFYILIVVFATDTCAYFVGRTIGKTPLAPNISPNKTREGSIAGFVGAVVASALSVNLLGLNAIMLEAILLGSIIGILAQLGDLAESSMKRKAGVKDSGFLIPGHGGLLDRIDSILLPLPVVFYFVIWEVQQKGLLS